MKIFITKIITKIFIDNPYLCYYGCHRNPKRSFFINNRQFNVCARCTGESNNYLRLFLGVFFGLTFIHFLGEVL